MRPVNNNYFNYTDTSINSLEVDSLSDTHYWVNPIPYLYYTLHKNWSPGYFFTYIKCRKTYFLANWKAKHIGGPSGKVQLFYPFRIKFMKIDAHAHMNDLSIINLVLC